MQAAAQHTPSGFYKTELMDQKTKHTPGEWNLAIDGSPSVFPNNYIKITVAYDCCPFNERREGELHANARLVAAAPKLLEALRGIESAVNKAFSIEHGQACLDFVNEVARAAIAEAEGAK